MKRMALILFLTSPLVLRAQTITSTAAGGTWDHATTWIGGTIPTTSNCSQIIIAGSVGAGVSSRTVNHLRIDPGGILTGSGNVTILGDLINDGIFHLTGGTTSFAGNHQRMSGQSDSTTFSSVTFSASVTASIPFISTGPLSVRDSLITDAGFSALGSLTVSSTGVLIADTIALNVVGSCTISSPGVLIAASAIFSGNISASGTLRVTSTATFNGNTTLTGSGSKILNDVLVSGVLTPNAVYSIAGNLTVSEKGLLNAGANTTVFQGIASRISSEAPGPVPFNDLTVMPGTALTSSSPLFVNGPFVISGSYVSNNGFTANSSVSVSVDTGSVTVNNKPFSIAGTLTVSSGAVMVVQAGADATLSGNISASGSLTILSTLFLPDTTVLTGGGSKTFNSVVISGMLTPNATQAIAGDLILTGRGNLAEGTSTTTFTGGNSSLLNTGTGAGTFHNIVIASGAQVTNTFPLKINGTFRVAGTFNAGADVFVKSTLTVSRGAKLSAEIFSVETAGNLAISGTYNSSGVTKFSGNTKITGAGAKNFNDIVITGSLTSYTGSITVTGNIQDDGTFIHSNGTVLFTGNTKKIIATSLPGPSPMEFYNIMVNNGTAIIDLDFEMPIDLVGTLTLQAGTTLDADGAADDQIFTLLSTNDDPATDASIAALPDDALVSGNFTVQRYLSGEGRIYRYLSSPVQGVGATVAAWQRSFPITGGFADPSDPGIICNRLAQIANPSLFFYDEPTKSYIAFPKSGFAYQSNLIPGKGYAAFIRACVDSTLISVSGSLISNVNRGTVMLPVTHTDSVKTYNNLVGNPFPSAIDWDKVTLLNVSPTLAIRDNGTGVFQYYTKGGGGALDVPGGVIAQGQAFWIRTTKANPSVMVTESCKTSSTASSGTVFYRSTEPDLLEIRIQGSSSLQEDKARIMISPLATNSAELDDLDAPKMNNQRDDPYEELLDIYTTSYQSPLPLAINALPSISCNTPFFLSIRDLTPGEFQLAFKKYGLFKNFSVAMYDRFSGREMVADEDGLLHFSVTEDPGSFSLERFTINFNSVQLDVALQVDFPSGVCGLDSAIIGIHESQPGVQYFAMQGDHVVSDTISGNSATGELTIPGKNLAESFDLVTLIAKGACSSTVLDTSAMIRKILLPVPVPGPGERCRAGSVTLTGTGASGNEIYRWYDSIDARSPIFTGAQFSPDLKHTQVYFVAIADSLSGCEGVRAPVRAVIVHYDDASITVNDQLTLQSNFASGNHWYLDSLALPDTTAVLKISGSGLYKLKVMIGRTCSTQADRLVTITGSNDVSVISAYPNPVTGILNVELPPGQLLSENLDIFDASGRRVGIILLMDGISSQRGQFDFNGLPGGVYFIPVGQKKKSGVIRVIK